MLRMVATGVPLGATKGCQLRAPIGVLTAVTLVIVPIILIEDVGVTSYRSVTFAHFVTLHFSLYNETLTKSEYRGFGYPLSVVLRFTSFHSSHDSQTDHFMIHVCETCSEVTNHES